MNPLKKTWLKIAPKKGSLPTAALRATGKGKRIDDFKDIVNQIARQFKDQSRKDIQKWRKALQMADLPEKPRLNFYHDLIDDLLTDGHLQAQIQLRANATLNTEFQIGREGNINEEATKFLKQQWFYDFQREAIMSILRGTKVLQFTKLNGLNVKLETIPQRNVVPVLQTVFPDLSKEEGIRYDDPYYENWIVQVGKDKDLGVLNNIVPAIIWKRNVMQAWAEFCERFGLPMVAAYTNRGDQESIDRIDTMLSKLAQAARGVFAEGTRVEFKEANRTDAYQVFDKFIERNNREISEAIVGGTMLTDDGSSRSQSEVHERNLDDKIAAPDKRFVEFLVNDKLLPLLRNQGYSFVKEGYRFSFDRSHKLPLEKFWTITQGLMQSHEVDTNWLSKTFNIPVTGKKKDRLVDSPKSKFQIPKSKFQNLNSAKGIPLGQIPNSANPCQRHPFGEGFLWKGIPLGQSRNYPTACCPEPAPEAAGGEFQRKILQIQKEMLQQLWDGSALNSEAKMMALEADYLMKALLKGWGKRRMEADFNAPDHLALQMMEFNLFEFSASKTEARLASLSQLLVDKETLNIRSFSDFKREAEKITNQFDKNWLRTEYNLSVAVGQNSAAYLRFMAEKDEVTSLVRYQTAGDSKVCSEHQILDGKVFSLNDREARDLWPPNGYGCRCEMVQHLGEKNTVISQGGAAKKLLGDKFLTSQFNLNRGDLKQVFTKKQFYASIKGLDEKLNNMKFDSTYGLKPWETFKNKLKPIKLDHTITGENVKELFKANVKRGKRELSQRDASGMGFTDYLKRKMILSKESFDRHTRGKYLKPEEQRHLLFPHLQSILNEPDEVWLNNHDRNEGTFQVRYLKFYKDRAVIIDTNLEGDNMEISTWYNLKVEDGDKRNGLLIKKE